MKALLQDTKEGETGSSYRNSRGCQTVRNKLLFVYYTTVSHWMTNKIKNNKSKDHVFNKMIQTDNNFDGGVFLHVTDITLTPKCRRIKNFGKQHLTW